MFQVQHKTGSLCRDRYNREVWTVNRLTDQQLTYCIMKSKQPHIGMDKATEAFYR